MESELVPYDSADLLIDEETISGYLSAALESGGVRIIAKALGAVARARGGVERLARDTGISSEALTRALEETGNPDFAVVLKIMSALGVRLSATMVA